MAVRIPAGWLDPDQEVTLTRDPITRQITLHQNGSAMIDLLRSWQQLPEIKDEEFTLNLRRETLTDARSIFEIQEAEERERATD